MKDEGHKIGEIIDFGRYKWRVLAVEADKELLITEDIIEQRAYHDTYTATNWEDCDLRNKYLKTEFYNSFSEEKKRQIILWENENKANQWYGTDGGNATQDYIFLLSLEEVCKYFGDGSSTNLLENKGNQDYWIGDTNNTSRLAKYSNNWAGWWLRSPGDFSSSAAYVYNDGFVDVLGIGVTSTDRVRPALWLKR